MPEKHIEVIAVTDRTVLEVERQITRAIRAPVSNDVGQGHKAVEVLSAKVPDGVNGYKDSTHVITRIQPDGFAEIVQFSTAHTSPLA
jgi:hypothetical protein